MRTSAFGALSLRKGAVTLLPGAVAAVVLALPVDRHLVLLNTTPSEPIGLYLRTRSSLAPGRLIAFPAPPAAFPYADARLAFLHHTPLLKTIAADAGDQVCTTDGIARINGRPWGAVAMMDQERRTLPRWRVCRRLRPGELFALADRVPNSFDSRYFGPVPTGSVIGVYRPLLVMTKRP